MSRIQKDQVSKLNQVSDNLWIIDGPIVRWFTMPFPTRMVIARLKDSSLFVHSPIRLTAEVRADVEQLGKPRYLISPNKIHHLFMAEWQAAYGGALSFSPPGLAQKRPDLRFDGHLSDDAEPGWAEEIDQLIFRGSCLLDEVVFFHKPSRTLILGDLIENFDPRSLSVLYRTLALFGRILAPHGQTPLDYRQTFRGRYDIARKCLRRVFEWEPQAVIMCHGIPVFENAGLFLEKAFAWLSQPQPAGAADGDESTVTRSNIEIQK